MGDEHNGSDTRVRQALELLAAAAREHLARHPHGYLALGNERLELPLTLPLGRDQDRLTAAVQATDEMLREGLESLLLHRATIRPGRVWCIRCASADCAHSAPGSPRETFAGYGPSGLPRFVDFAQWLLASRDPRVSELYGDKGRTVAVIAPTEELTGALLPAFQPASDGFRLHGQVTAGWYRLAAPGAPREPVAVTFQVISSEHRGSQRSARRRFGLAVLAQGPDGTSLEAAADRRGELPWAAAARWAQGVVSTFEAGRGSRAQGLDRRLEGFLAALARRLEKGERARERRTGHAEERHDQGNRPTRMAWADLARAQDDALLFDTRRKTFVVLGDRGRAHVFNPAGKLVTSIRYTPAAIERRQANGLWRPALRDEVMALRERVEGGQAALVPRG